MPAVQGVLPARLCLAEPVLPFCHPATRLWSSATNTGVLQLPGCNGRIHNPLDPLIALLVSHLCRQPKSRTPRGRAGRVQASATGHTAARQRCDFKKSLLTVYEHPGCCEWPIGVTGLLVSLQRCMLDTGNLAPRPTLLDGGNLLPVADVHSALPLCNGKHDQMISCRTTHRR